MSFDGVPRRKHTEYNRQPETWATIQRYISAIVSGKSLQSFTVQVGERCSSDLNMLWKVHPLHTTLSSIVSPIE